VLTAIFPTQAFFGAGVMSSYFIASDTWSTSS
jgi:hypothetical protein